MLAFFSQDKLAFKLSPPTSPQQGVFLPVLSFSRCGSDALCGHLLLGMDKEKAMEEYIA